MKTITLSVIIFSGLQFSCSTTKSSLTPNHSDLIQSTSLLAGFQVLSIPRDEINIGGQWLNGQGPFSSGLDSSDLVTSKSLTDYEFQSDSEFNIKAKVGLLKYFGIDASINNIKAFNLVIDKAEITRVNDISKLNYSSGKTFIWEGIKVKSISLVVTKDRKDSISALLNTKQMNDVQLNTIEDNFNNKKITLNGVNLYIAYRLISFGELKSEVFGPRIIEEKARFNGGITKNEYETESNCIEIIERGSEKLQSGGYSQNTNCFYGFKFKEQYEGTMYGITEFNEKFSESEQKEMICTNNTSRNKSILLITDYSEFINSHYKLIKVNINNNNNQSEDLRIVIGSKIQGNEFIVDELNMRIGYFSSSGTEPLPLTQNLFFSIKRISIPITTFTDETVPGWN